jgi:hypothetical protein
LWLTGVLGLAASASLVFQAVAPEGGMPISYGVVGALVSCGALVRALSKLRQSVHVYEHGLTWKTFFHTTMIDAEHVAKASIVQRYSRGWVYTEVRIQQRDAAEVAIGGITDLDALCSYAARWAAAASASAPSSAAGAAPGWIPPAGRSV